MFGIHSFIKERTEIDKYTGCVEWQNCKNKRGYGKVFFNGQYLYAHRLSWELEKGKIPKDLCVLHKCDNPSCCNVNHLFLGTRTENHKDMVSKKRHTIGTRNGMAKLNNKNVKSIKSMLSFGFTNEYIAKKYNVCRTTISNIKTKKIWRHI